jgi:hypothetical protein
MYIALLATFLVGLIYLWIFRNQINPDGVSYIQVAREYASFDIKTAVNGYWAPLLSWLLVPFIWMKIEPLYAYRFITLLLSLLLVAAAGYILNRQQPLGHMQKILQALFLSTFGILIIQWGGSVITPDILSGIVLTLCMFMMYQHIKNPQSLKIAIFFGCMLALLYFSKSIGFYISLATLAVTSLYTYRFTKAYRSLIVIGSIFTLLSAAWIGLIYLKYETLTISTSSNYNFSLYGPSRPDHPQTVIGYLPAPHEDSVWAWDDPSYFTLPQWKVTENLWYFKFHFINTLSQATNLFLITSPLLLVGLYAIFAVKKNPLLKFTGYVLLLMSLLTLLAYSVVLYVEPRYIWFIAVPIITFGLITTLSTKHVKPLLLFISLVLLASLLNTYSFYQKSDEIMYTEASIKNLSQGSQKHIPKGASVAGLYPYNYKYCFFSQTKCQGSFELSGNINRDSPIIDQMRNNNIHYYVDFSDKNLSYLPVEYSATSPLNELCFDGITGKNASCKPVSLTVYRLQ